MVLQKLDSEGNVQPLSIFYLFKLSLQQLHDVFTLIRCLNDEFFKVWSSSICTQSDEFDKSSALTDCTTILPLNLP